MNKETSDVLIVGAGPTGLMTACQLSIHKVSFRIIDKNESSSVNSGALIVQARSLEIFEQMGIAGEAVESGIIANNLNIVFNGTVIARTSIKDIGGNLSPFPFLLLVEQSKTEKLLLKFLDDYGHSVEWGVRFNSFIQDDKTVTSILTLSDGSEQSIVTKYIIAADGANSTIRDSMNISFKGTTFPHPIFILDCKAKTDMLPGEICFAFSKSIMSGFFPLQSSRWRIDSTLPKELEGFDKVTFEKIAEGFKLWTNMNITFQECEWFSVFRSHQKYAGSIRVQNCILAGDAAHVNTPVGAQGMNTGLQDAFNLAWKLAFVVKNKANPQLLDTYTTERSGISKGFARYADTVFRLVTSNNFAVKFFRLYVLKGLFKFLFPVVEKRRVFRQMFFKSISQIDIHYRTSTLSDRTGEEFFLHGAPRSGDRLPYNEFIYRGKNTSTYKILEVSCFNLIVLANVLPVEISKLAEEFKLAVKVISFSSETKELYKSLGIKNSGYCLVRPDMHIALRSYTLDAKRLKLHLKHFLIVL